MGVIYLRKNKVNGMMYVGKSTNFVHREYNWKNTKWKYGNQLLTDNRNKYGLDNFETIILKEVDDSELDRWEKHCIKILNTIYPNGYNDNEGGSLGFHHSQRTKYKISLKNKGNTPHNKGKTYEETYSEETAIKLKKIISDLAKTRVGEKNSFYGKTFKIHPMQGKHLSEEAKSKIGKANKNGKTAKPIVQVKNDGAIIEWASLREAARNGYDCGNVSKAVNNIYHNGNYYRSSHWYFKSDYEHMKDLNLVLN